LVEVAAISPPGATPYSGNAELMLTGLLTDTLAAPPPDTVTTFGTLGDCHIHRDVKEQRVPG